jgi:hypothetical protein
MDPDPVGPKTSVVDQDPESDPVGSRNFLPDQDLELDPE